ncbi:hypothetical protein EV360DRAFT_52727 [Lentinula raphanica]|nr:hypothetical protein EV360DRAFT_52727 [Lentinula raphanica]
MHPSSSYLLSSDGDYNWSTLTPTSSGGFIYHPQYNKFYTISMYHQIHCLNALRRYIAQGMTTRANLHLTNEVLSHTNHCLDYLRQALLCQGDTTLEPVHEILVPADVSRNVTEHLDLVSQGWNVIHRCKDWTVVREYAEENWKSWPDEYKDRS